MLKYARSSANRIEPVMFLFILSGISLMKMLNKIGLRTAPCGVPVEIAIDSSTILLQQQDNKKHDETVNDMDGDMDS